MFEMSFQHRRANQPSCPTGENQMANHTVITAPKLYARVAGLLYLIVIVAGIFAEIFVRSRLVVASDTAATAHNIVTHELLYRFGFAAELIEILCGVFLALIFYELF